MAKTLIFVTVVILMVLAVAACRSVPEDEILPPDSTEAVREKAVPVPEAGDEEAAQSGVVSGDDREVPETEEDLKDEAAVPEIVSKEEHPEEKSKLEQEKDEEEVSTAAVEQEEEVSAAAEKPEGEVAAVEEAPETKKEEVAVVEEESFRIPSRNTIIGYLESMIVPPLYLVTRGKKALIQLEDLNRDEIPEVIVPCVELEEEQEELPDTDSFSDFSSLYKKDSLPHVFSLCLFQINREGLTLEQHLNLGYRYVYGGLKRIPIDRRKSTPFVLSAVFQTKDSEEQEWFVFMGRSFRPVSRLSLRDSYTNTVQIDDIDGDGIVDVLIKDRGEEEGIGMESYLTWLKWSGKGFTEYASTTVVRSLRIFLSQAKERLLSEDWGVLLNLAFLPEDVSNFRKQGWKDVEILVHAFRLDELYDMESTSAEEILKGIKEFFFTDILEDPFILRDEKGTFFQWSFRLVDANGLSLVSEIPVYMHKNPFDRRQFFISLP
jgi:hypothetical protein